MVTRQPNLIMTNFQLAALLRAQRGCDRIQYYITEVTASHNDRLMVRLHHTVPPLLTEQMSVCSLRGPSKIVKF